LFERENETANSEVTRMKQLLTVLLLFGITSIAFAQVGPSGPGGQRTQPRAPQQQPQRDPDDREQVLTFDQADTNNDGQLSKDEVRGIRGLRFAKADLNEDDSLDRQEYAAATVSIARESSESDQRTNGSSPQRERER
jgi:EF hand